MLAPINYSITAPIWAGQSREIKRQHNADRRPEELRRTWETDLPTRHRCQVRETDPSTWHRCQVRETDLSTRNLVYFIIRSLVKGKKSSSFKFADINSFVLKDIIFSFIWPYFIIAYWKFGWMDEKWNRVMCSSYLVLSDVCLHCMYL